ncbi:glycoside hydrolase family 65 protein [Chitinophaga sp. MM2321]|uniref:glycoside hydrolase family 65 protein n=1 Tax=Chitinophaga sp. MM2321 TaxID=3137178 RepID=UPI0032D580CB
MKSHIKTDEWNIIEEGFDAALNKYAESIFSLGNGCMGQRANFEEAYTGSSLQGNYIAGVYYTDKTRVGWWKNGYPEYAAKVLNAANWIGIDIQIGTETLDLHQCNISSFKRVLHMKEGYLERTFTATLKDGREISVKAIRFCSIADDTAGAIRYGITPLNFDGDITFTPFIDGDIRNQDANYDEKFWEETAKESDNESAYLTMRTKKTNFDVCTGMYFSVAGNVTINSTPVERTKFIGRKFTVHAQKGVETVFYKYAVNISGENTSADKLLSIAKSTIKNITAKGFDQLLREQANAWEEKWKESDIVIEGDVKAQQAIRFNIFQLNQTYTGRDPHLNIGPKGFTGEKYGGATHWDTEAYCVPFYLATADPSVTKNLLLYRYHQLDKAIENARKLGFNNGAALYPMVTMNGEECHNEWEITFEEIHRNGAVAFAIYNYVRYTGDETYLVDYGLEVLTGIARFWSQRVNWSEARNKYVMLGITGPNEYENNVNNNWYTNTIAAWCLEYALETIETVKQAAPQQFMLLVQKLDFKEAAETDRWKHIIDNMYYPVEETLDIYLQQDGYMDKEQILVKDLPETDRPLNQQWSWDRILRSCYIKQADVLQGIYFFEDRYDIDTIRRNFEFYEPRTVHESSLSPCVHAILAAKLGKEQQAYEFYLRTGRLDLDDYNNDTDDGLHITSMAGTWMSVVEGFAGMRVHNGQLHFNPFLPEKWASFSFNIIFRGAVLNIRITKTGVHISNLSGKETDIYVYGRLYEQSSVIHPVHA